MSSIMNSSNSSISKYLSVVLILGMTISAIAKDTIPVGGIEGRIVDSDTKSELTGANLLLIGTSFGASADIDGKYQIQSVPAGSYSVQCTYLGYATKIIPDIIVKPGRFTQVNIELTETAIETGGVTVTPSYFSATEAEPVSAVAMSYEEIRRAPGSAGDVSRIIMSLPSVAKVNDTRNNLVVRGGSPVENGYYVDGMPIPNINHFPAQGASGGAMGVLNVDFIEDVKFYAGGFSAEYGDRLSSITDIRYREGSTNGLEGQIDMGMIGLGAVLEGPLQNERGAWFVSARRSYLDLVVNAFDVEASAIPDYGDLQGKISYNLSDKHRLTFLNVLGIDDSKIKKDDAIDNKENFYGQADWIANTTGLNWRWLWGKRGYSSTSLTHNYMSWDSEWKEALTTDLLTKDKSTEQRTTLRNTNHLVTASGSALDAGFETQFVAAALDYTIAQDIDPFGNTTPEIIRNEDIQSVKAGVFASFRQKFGSRVTVTPGVRFDYFDYNDHSQISPRLSFSYLLTSTTTLNGAYGRYYQFLPLLLLSQSPQFKDLDEPAADHIVLGVSHLLSKTTRMTVEVYDKYYTNLPLDPDQPLLSVIDESSGEDNFTAHERLVDTGAARTSGVELMIQKKLAEDFYGLISGSVFRSRYRDYNGTWRNRIYDNRWMATIEGGYKPNLSWDFSLKWVFAGGAPYTPFDQSASSAVNSGILNEQQVNESRLPDYHSMNIRVDRRFHYRASSLIVYLSVWNVYGRENIASYYWNEIDNIQDTYTQWSTLPVLGLEYEF